MAVDNNDLFKPIVTYLESNLHGNFEVTPDSVYHEGNEKNELFMKKVIEKLLLPGSGISNAEAFKKLFDLAAQGKSCMILMQHVSNLDYPLLWNFLYDTLGIEACRRLFAISSLKLDQDDPLIAVFAKNYNRLVVYPSRLIDKVTDPEKLKEVRKISNPINHAAMKELIKRKHSGDVVLIFPAGTRTRPWDDKTTNGVREIYTYLKSFDYFLLAAMNGNILKLSRSESMVSDIPTRDIVQITATNVELCDDFIQRTSVLVPDPKQAVVDSLMSEIKKIHDEVEPARLDALKKLGEIEPVSIELFQM